jgi:type II secretory ATPase GspE/PulE/Tfp pilus assembly ATPase PilB-like protein
VRSEYQTQCWSCLGEFDAAAAVWCTCSAGTPTKLCPFCFHCFCQADIEYQDGFWSGAPEELKEERRILKDAAGSIGESLIRSNLLTTDQLVSALRWQQSRGGSLDDAVVDLDFVSRENLRLVSGRTTASVSTIDLSHGLIDASLVSSVSVEVCVRKRVLPISKEEIGEKTVLTLAMAGPTDVETIDQIQSLTNCTIIPMAASAEEILKRLTDLFPKEVEAIRASEAEAPGLSLSARRARPQPAAGGAESPPARQPPARGKPRRPARSGRAAAAPSALEEIDEIAATGPGVVISAAPEVAARAPAAAPGPPPAAAAPLPAETPVAETAPAPPEDIVAALQKIFSEAISRKASSIQFEVRGKAITLFLRIDGILYRARTPVTANPLLLPRAIAERASLPREGAPACGRMTIKAGERKIDLVVRRLASAGGESLLLKVIDRADFVRRPEDLGPSSLDLQRIQHALAQPKGLVILSGPLHNGVESTRYALLAYLARDGRRVSSLESPLLLPLEGIRQEDLATAPDADRLRAAAARLSGSEVLFLPEIQAPGSAALALEISSSCLVVASLQARRASQVPAALLWHGIDPAALAAALRLVVNQRMVRRLCEGCRTATQAADQVLKMMGLAGDEALDLKIFQGTGCDRCGPLSPGYAGRVALFEVMEGTPDVAALIAAGGAPGEVEREARRAGMSPLRAACLARVGQGVTTLEEFQKGNF